MLLSLLVPRSSACLPYIRGMATERITITGEHTADELQAIAMASVAFRSDGGLNMALNRQDALQALLDIPLEEMDHDGERARLVVGEWRKSLDEVTSWIDVQQACTAPPRQFIPARDWRS